MTWNPDQYLKFQAEREAPFYDLISHLKPVERPSIIDLGCGPGNLTVKLLDRFPDARVLGIDSSPEMLVKAAGLATEQVQFAMQDLREVQGEHDIVFSHAVLQWLPDHPGVLQHMWNLLKPGGQLAVQLPSNFDHATHRIARELVQKDPYREFVSPEGAHRNVLPLDQYAEVLYALGGQDIQCYQKVYPHVVPGAEGMLEWVKGTLLVPILGSLPEELKESFLMDMLSELKVLYPGDQVFYGFKRTLLYAQRSS
ncbi:methyltransferase domain-containing protein [Deinococcus cellulosilyticus]|uniref:Trans-aconitate 2-methyltransferase n=1 Tax=Deinococcus cellulosilyticus (strain DSM 18568 / NBRC 106333 / KACC 11606 / 5516J-15) TaxID=1223518 RepID=A0A511N0V4_DEIC1|nr:methyltransferase domain-containing protein [Deinococcus cellulosilyticus]GEM46078.1 trans-aconitate 2-methyltransferase [Deinococcus cellulosilyticus NBRC 106333 = KACC 11606]